MSYIDRERLISFFLEGMRAGYVSDAEPMALPDEPYSKVHVYERDGLLLKDRWRSAPGRIKSSGETMIWYNGVPLWWMSYYGQYAPVAIPLLKSALAEAYVTKREFIAGRGPLLFLGDTFTYINQPHETSNFDRFRGSERILEDTSQLSRGYHDYMGGRL
jgi:hypothetical protein